MTEYYEPVSGDEYWYRRGEWKCICGHWEFSHEFGFETVLGLRNRFCHDCKCPKLKRETKVTEGSS